MTPTGRRPDSFGLMARGAGALWIVTILCGIFAEAYVRGQLIVTVRQPRNGPPEANARNGSKRTLAEPRARPRVSASKKAGLLFPSLSCGITSVSRSLSFGFARDRSSRLGSGFRFRLCCCLGRCLLHLRRANRTGRPRRWRALNRPKPGRRLRSPRAQRLQASIAGEHTREAREWCAQMARWQQRTAGCRPSSTTKWRDRMREPKVPCDCRATSSCEIAIAAPAAPASPEPTKTGSRRSDRLQAIDPSHASE